MDRNDYLKLPSIKEAVESSLEGVSARIILGRMNGASPRDICLEEGLSRAETRRIEREGLESVFEKVNLVQEDYYRYLYERYDLSEDFFRNLDNGTQIFYCLKNRYKSGFEEPENAIDDPDLSDDIKTAIRTFYNLEIPEEVQTEEIQQISTEATAFSASPVVYNTKQLPDQVVKDIDELWTSFITSGITNPVEIIEQISLFFILKKLDDDELQNIAEAYSLSKPVKNLYFDSMHQNCRWSYFHNVDAYELYSILTNEAIPYIRNELYTDTGITASKYIKAVHLKTKDAALILRIVSYIDSITSKAHVSLSVIFDELLKKCGFNHEIDRLAYRLSECTLEDTVCCPFFDNSFDISSFALNVKKDYQQDLELVWNKAHFMHEMFFAYSTDNAAMLISSMRMLLAGINEPCYEDKNLIVSSEDRKYTRVIAAIPSKFNVESSDVKPSIRSFVSVNNASLMSMYACHQLLEDNGICVLLVPHKVFTDSTGSHKKFREFLTSEVSVTNIVSLPDENSDLLVYRNVIPFTNHEVLFSRVETYEIDDICSISSPVSLEAIRKNSCSLCYEDYFKVSENEIVEEIPVEDFHVLMRRIFNTEADISFSIKRIKELLENLS